MPPQVRRPTQRSAFIGDLGAAQARPATQARPIVLARAPTLFVQAHPAQRALAQARRRARGLAGLEGLGDWTPDHKDPSGAYVNADGLTFQDYQAVYSDPSSASAFQQGAQLTAIESSLSSGNQNALVAAGGMTQSQASGYVASRGYGPTPPTTSIGSGILDFGKSLFGGAAAVGTAVAPGLINKAASRVSIFAAPAPAPAPRSAPSSGPSTTTLVIGGVAVVVTLGILAAILRKK